MFDRETKREKIIEAKHREQKLKSKSAVKTDVIAEKYKRERIAEDEAILSLSVEREFADIISKIVSCLFRLLIFTIICAQYKKFF